MKKKEFVYSILNKIKDQYDIYKFLFTLNKKEFMKKVDTK